MKKRKLNSSIRASQSKAESKEPELLTLYMKEKYDTEIANIINDLLDNKDKYDQLIFHLKGISKIYEEKNLRLANLCFNIEKPKDIHKAFFTHFLHITTLVYDTIHKTPYTEKDAYVKKITAKLFSSNLGKNNNLRNVFLALFETNKDTDTINSLINNFEKQMIKERNIDPSNTVLNDIIKSEINEKTPIDFKLKNVDFLSHFQKTFAWNFFTADATHRCVVNTFLNQSLKDDKEAKEALKNYLTIIYRAFYSYEFFNADGDTYEYDEDNDFKIEVKKSNDKINIDEADQNLTPYASMEVVYENGKKTPYNKAILSINDKIRYINFTTGPTSLIAPDIHIPTTPTSESQIKICSYNLNSGGETSKIISNHSKNILYSDIILLQELNENNKEIVIGTTDMMRTTDEYVPLTFSKDVCNILNKKRMQEVINDKYYNVNRTTTKRIGVPLRESALKTGNGSASHNKKYNMIYFPNRISKSSDNVKLNAIMYDSDKIKITEVFVGLLDSNKYLKYRHFCLCCKYKESDNEICVINIHLDTDYNKKIQISEIKYLFYEIIQKERFFRNIDRYIIGGDFNTDAYDIAIELIKMQKKFENKNHELKDFHKTILFNNIVTRGGLKSLDKDGIVSSSLNKKDILKNNGMSLDNIIILDRYTIDPLSIQTYVGYNRTSGTMEDYYNPKDIKCHGIPSHLEKSKKKEHCKKHFSDHSPIFAVFPKLLNQDKITRKESFLASKPAPMTMEVESVAVAPKSKSPMTIDFGPVRASPKSKMDSSVLEEKRNIELLSSHKKIKLLKELLNVFKQHSNSDFVSKYKEILTKHLQS